MNKNILKQKKITSFFLIHRPISPRCVSDRNNNEIDNNNNDADTNNSNNNNKKNGNKVTSTIIKTLKTNDGVFVLFISDSDKKYILNKTSI